MNTPWLTYEGPGPLSPDRLTSTLPALTCQLANVFSIQAVYSMDFIAGQYAGIHRWHALRGRTMKNLRHHVCQFELDFNGRKLYAIKRKYALEVHNRFKDVHAQNLQPEFWGGHTMKSIRYVQCRAQENLKVYTR